MAQPHNNTNTTYEYLFHFLIFVIGSVSAARVAEQPARANCALLRAAQHRRVAAGQRLLSSTCVRVRVRARACVCARTDRHAQRQTVAVSPAIARRGTAIASIEYERQHSDDVVGVFFSFVQDRSWCVSAPRFVRFLKFFLFSFFLQVQRRHDRAGQSQV